MRRHWCITLWYHRDQPIEPVAGWLDVRHIIADAIETGRQVRMHYLAWSLEDGTLEDQDPPSGESQNESVAERKSPGVQAPPLSRTADEGLHIHLYIETERSVRWSTVVNKYQRDFKGAHVEARIGWRSTAREYALGLRGGAEKHSHITGGEWGDWRPDTGDSTPDAAEMAASMVLSGQSPISVARAFPVWFIRNGAGIIRLWETINRTEWRGRR